MRTSGHEPGTTSAADRLLTFHLGQDLVEFQGDAWGAVVAYVLHTSPQERTACAAELRRIVQDAADDGQVAAVVRARGMAYDPTADGHRSFGGWLDAVARTLDDPDAAWAPPTPDAATPSVGVRRASSFTDRQVAERAVATNLRLNRRAIAAWTARHRNGPNQAFEYRHSGTIGRVAQPGASLEDIHDVDRSRVILRKEESAPEGWFVLVSYPVATPDPRVTDGIDRTSRDWDALWTLFGGYLHQDFDIHGGAWDAVAAFEAEALAGQAHRAAAAIRRLLSFDDDDDLTAAAEWLGLDYHPPGDGWALRDWLAALAARLER